MAKIKKSLLDYNPQIASEWHPTKNGTLTPADVCFGAEKRVWWKCKEGHEWDAVITNRTYKNSSCPYCKNRKALKGFNDLATTHPDIAAQWHPTKNGELTPFNVTAGSAKEVWWLCKRGHETKQSVFLKTKHKKCKFCPSKTLISIKGVNDLATVNPFLAKQWHPTKNEGVTPSDVHHNSPELAWWMCENDHEWQASINGRAHTQSCPFCPGTGVVQGVNDLATTHPELVKEWHPSLNGDLTPSNVTAGSGKKVWWICSEKHEWIAALNHRSRGSKCPTCAKKSKTHKILAIERPDLAKEWHPTKNGNVTPFDVTCGLIKKFWWQCEAGHEWEAGIANRVRGTGCPYCPKKLKPQYSLAAAAPDVAAEWHPTKNGDKTPFNVSRTSTDKFWWQCKEGHEWRAAVYPRTKHKNPCPCCTHQTLIANGNNLETKFPKLAAEWHPTKNGAITPADVTPYSTLPAWWVCLTCGYEWQTPVTRRAQKSKCPCCFGNTALPGYTDLATTHPEIAKEWHPTKNGSLKPNAVKAGSNKKVWWLCSICGYEWQTTVNNRKRSKGCPSCFGRSVLPGYTDLATTHPEIAKEWHQTKNKDLSADKVKSSSTQKVWWQCSVCGREWNAPISERVLGAGCPSCSQKTEHTPNKPS